MSRNGSGIYNLPTGNPVVTGTTITSNWANTTLSDLATAMTGSVAADGQTPITGNLQMGGNKVTDLGAPSSSTDATTKSYVDAAITTATGTLGTMSTQNANNVAITGGTIAGVAITGGTIASLSSALPVASGGTGSTSLTANNVLLGNGTSAVQAVAPSTSGYALRSNGTTWTSQRLGLGMTGETYHDVTASRASGSTYTAPAYPIMVLVVASSSGSGANHALNVYVSGNQVTYTVQYAAGNDSPQVTFIVPANATYRVDISGAGLGLAQWTELY